MLSDIQTIIKWWLYILLFGMIFLPFSQKYFSRFLDRGYMFSKCLGIAAASYIVWLLSSLHILKFTSSAIWLSLVLLFIMVYFFCFKQLRLSRKLVLICLVEELLFLLLLIFWSYVRGHQPDIYGLEKFMDFGFVNSLLRTDYMPPLDIWFAGKPINYYYYGHYLCAFLIKLTGVEPSAGYNLMLALVFAFTFTLTFSLAASITCMLYKKNAIKKAIIAGLISALLVTFGGNLHCFIYEYAKPFYQSVMHIQSDNHEYFYPDSTRYIGYNPPTHDKTIHEFPIYSFVVSDLHGHVSDIPIVLSFMAMALALINRKTCPRWHALSTENVLISLFLAIMYMTNTWDYPIYLTVFMLVTAYMHIRASLKGNYSLHMEDIQQVGSAKGSVLYPFAGLLAEWVKVILLSQLFILPFRLKFEKIAGGIGFVHAHTPLYQFLVLWGHQLFFIFAFMLFIGCVVYSRYKRLPLLKSGEKPGKVKTLCRIIFAKLRAADIFILILCCSALGLLIIPEIVYVIDIYSSDYHRANTMFKLTYQAFIMAGIVAGYIMVRILGSMQKRKFSLIVYTLFIVMFALPLLYPFTAINGYYEGLSLRGYKGLYGMRFLNDISAEDAKAVKWLNENIKGQPTVLEADGDSYSDYERISSMTGLPTVQGWRVHEWLWRSSRQAPLDRSKEVTAVYESDDMQKTLDIIRKYDISYIMVGKLERQKYKNLKADKLQAMGDVVFESNDTFIVRVRR